MFIADRENFKVFDPERMLELFGDGGGSDGRVGFKIVGDGFSCTFDGYRTVRDANSREKLERPEINKTAVWELRNAGPALPGLNLRDTYDILSDAVQAQARLSTRYAEVNWEVSVPTEFHN